jgi:hypothetical protein
VRKGAGEGAACTRRGIGIHDRNALLASTVLEEALLSAIVASTCQARKVEKNGDFLVLGCLGREVEVQCHFAASGCGIMGELEEPAAEGGDCCCGFKGHFEVKGGYLQKIGWKRRGRRSS